MSAIRNPQSAIIVIGASQGGLSALKILLATLPKDFPLPVVVALHRGKDSDNSLSEHLGKYTSLTVMETEDKEVIRPGHVYFAPGNYHLLVEGEHFALSTEETVNYARPSIDVLFESAAHDYGKGVIGIILTGANADGAQGLAVIKKSGGVAIVQDPATAESPSMPEAAIAATAVDKVLPVEEIAQFLVEMTR